MGDKSPKAKEKNKKQDNKGKQQKADAAREKAHPTPSVVSSSNRPGKPGKP
jgi:hypothetical protein